MQFEDNKVHSVIISIFVTHIFESARAMMNKKAKEARAEPGNIDQTVSFRHY